MTNVSELINGILIDSFAKSVVILMAVLAVLSVLHFKKSVHSHVHASHRVWVFLIVSMLLVPLLSIALPRLSVPVPFLSSNSTETASTANASAEVPVNSSEPDKLRGKAKAFSSGESPNEIVDSAFGEEALRDVETLQPRIATADTSRSSPIVIPVKTTSSDAIPWSCVVAITWAAVCVLLISRMFVAKIWTLRLLRRASDIAWSEDIGSARIVQSEEVSSPAVSGLFSHTIILPASWRQWDDEKRQAVIAHELAHVDRRDGLVVFLAQLNTALFWFNPIAWIAKAKVNRLAELACDQQAVLVTGDRLGYAQKLVEIAAAKAAMRFSPESRWRQNMEFQNESKCCLTTHVHSPERPRAFS